MNTTNQDDIAKIRIGVALAGALLSFIAVYFDDLINADGVLYINMASAFLNGGLEETAKLHNWPAFSIMLAYIHKLTTIPLETSAYLLNGLLFALLNDTLIRISHKILPNKNQLLIAALFIICFQPINEYRDFVIRDIGYWAFIALSLYYFILYLKTPTLKIATIWQLVAIMSVLFRIEGIVILLGLPLFLFATQKPSYGLKRLLLLNYLFIISLLPITLMTLNSFSSHGAFNKIDAFSFYTNIDHFSAQLNDSIATIKTQILNKYSEQYAGIILISGLLAMLAYKLIHALNLGYILLYIISWHGQKQTRKNPTRSLLYYFSILNVLILTVFVLQQYFVTTRYTVMALISFLLLMLPILCGYLEAAWINRKRFIMTIASTILIINLADSLIQSNSKSYIKDAAIWAAENLPQESTILTDETIIQYYAKANKTGTNISVGNLNTHRNYDYTIAIKKKSDTKNGNSSSIEKLESVYNKQNKRGDRIDIYKSIDK
jgi:hypothetical protein